MYSKRLPLPLEIVINEDQEFSLIHVINKTYNDYFKPYLMAKDMREKLHDKFVFIQLDFIDYKPERFWHLISYKASDDKYTLIPCTNTCDSAECEEIKPRCDKTILLPNTPSLIGRAECLYRLKRINWINPILKLASENDPYIQEWAQMEPDNNERMIRKTYIRYKEGMVDYIIILTDYGKQAYKLITAYPIVHKGAKAQFDSNFQNYAKKNQS